MVNQDQADEYSDDSLFNIASWGADLSFRELLQMYADGDMVKPEFQRNYVWSKTVASRFIESILLGLPVPSIFLAKAKDDRLLIIDGYQRVMTMYDYILRKKYGSEGSIFRLTNSRTVNERWRNKSFDELDAADQRRLRQSTIHAIIFEQRMPKDDDTSMFQIFSRINSSGMTLNAQEIRNCVCQGPFNSLLTELNKNATWRKLCSAKSPSPRMLDIELILRFFAIRDMGLVKLEKKQINLRKYLDLYMAKCDESTLDEKRRDFERMIDFVHLNFGATAFIAGSSSNAISRQKINPVLFEAISVASDAFLRFGGVKSACNDLGSRKQRLLEDPAYQEAARFRTTDILNIEKRIELARKILFGVNT